MKRPTPWGLRQLRGNRELGCRPVLLRQALRAARGGFTLLELAVALVIGGIAVAAASALLLGLNSRADAIEASSVAVARSANAERLLRQLVGNLDASENTSGLRGDRGSVGFQTWCEGARGWLEPCRVRLAFHRDGGYTRLVVQRTDVVTGDLRIGPGVHVTVLRRDLESGQFLYLSDARNGGVWAESWETITLPRGIAVVLDQDTLVLPVR